MRSLKSLLGMGSRLRSGRQMPSAQYFNLATWHTINFAYTRKAWAEILDMHRQALEKNRIDRLMNLVRHRSGHWLALQVEAAKIALSESSAIQIELGRIEPGQSFEKSDLVRVDRLRIHVGDQGQRQPVFAGSGADRQSDAPALVL